MRQIRCRRPNLAPKTKPIHHWHNLPWLAGTAVLYAVLAKLVLGFCYSHGLPVVFWPGAGLGLATLLLGGRGAWAAIFAGAFVGILWWGESLPAAVLFAAANTLEPVLGALLLTRFSRFDPALPSARDFYRLLGLAGLVSPGVITAFVAWGLLLLGEPGGDAYWRLVGAWWMGNTLGIVLVTPLILVWRRPPAFRPLRALEALVVLGAALLIGQIVFLDWFHDWFHPYNRGYWMYLFVIPVAVRFGPHGVLPLLLGVTVQSMVGAAQGVGFFHNELTRSQPGNFWAYSMTLVTVGMSLATMLMERRMAHQALQKSEAELRQAHRLAAVGRWSWDLGTDTHRWSEEIFRIYGRDPALPPAVYPEVQQYFTPASWERLAAAVETALDSGQAYECDAEVVRSDGSHRWIVARGQAVRGPQGTIRELHGTVQDITQRKRVEAALAESEERMHLLIDHAPVALAMFDRNMCYLAVSHRWLADYGLLGRNIIGRHHYEVFPEIPERWKLVHRRGLAGDIVRKDEDRFERLDGTVQWQRWEVRPWQGADGSIGGIVVFTEDITDRKHAAEALQESEARFRATFEQAAVGICHNALDGRWLRMNRKLCEIVGYTEDELRAMSFQDITHPDDLQPDLANVKRLLSGEVPTYSMEKRYLRMDGSIVWVTLTAVLVRHPDGSPDYFLSIVQDITRRKRAEAALQALHTEMEHLMKFQVASQTAAAFAHELNQPLSAIASYAEAALRLLRRGNPRPDRLNHALESTAQQAQRAGRVVREMLDFMNRGEVETEAVPLNDLVQKVLARVEADGFGGVQFQLELDPGLAHVKANRLQVEKVLVNLIENGIQAMRDGGVAIPSIAVTVRTGADHGMAQVTVADNGPGIDRDALHRVFEPFFTTKPQGLGMGLAISRSIIEAHDGQLWVESEPGAGASFHFTLPFAE